MVYLYEITLHLVFHIDLSTWDHTTCMGPSWLWSYGSWIYNYLWNQCLSPLTLQVRIPLRWGVLDRTLCDKVCQWLGAGQWFSVSIPVSSTNNTDCHYVTTILLKVALNTIILTPPSLTHSTFNDAYWTIYTKSH